MIYTHAHDRLNLHVLLQAFCMLSLSVQEVQLDKISMPFISHYKLVAMHSAVSRDPVSVSDHFKKVLTLREVVFLKLYNHIRVSLESQSTVMKKKDI